MKSRLFNKYFGHTLGDVYKQDKENMEWSLHLRTYIYIYIYIRKRKAGGRLTHRDLYIVTKKWLEGAHTQRYVETRKEKPVGLTPGDIYKDKKGAGLTQENV